MPAFESFLACLEAFSWLPLSLVLAAFEFFLPAFESFLACLQAFSSLP